MAHRAPGGRPRDGGGHGFDDHGGADNGNGN